MNDIIKGLSRKVISHKIKAKMESWLKSIDNPDLVGKMRNDYIVTGGAITSMLLGEFVNDYDVYFQTPEVALEIVSYYLGKCAGEDTTKVMKVAKINSTNDGIEVYIKSAGVIRGEGDNQRDYDYFETDANGQRLEKYLNNETFQNKTSYGVAMITSNALSLRDDIQIITRFVGVPTEIHKNFDFIHCTNWFTHKEGLFLSSQAMESILSRQLNYGGSRYPLCSMFRLRKFIKRGWSINAGEMLKIGWDISELNLSDPKVLMEQTIGVDAAYFTQLLLILNNKENSTTYDRSYLFELINKVFNEPIGVGEAVAENE